MNTYSDDNDNINLRSKKVRRLIGDMPRALVLLGVGAIVIILLALLLAACFIPYPYSNGDTIIIHILNMYN